MAQRIQQDPLDFFGFNVNLGGSELPEAAASNNPPLVSFFMAAAALLTGWSERGLHLAFLVPALAATLGTWALARRLCGEPLVAALFCLACPVFLLSATTLMADVSMTALYCWSLWFWTLGLEQRRRGALLAGALLAALCALTKYFGITLLPLILAWSWHRERRIGAWAFYLLVPLAALVAYELYTARVYGVSAILSAAGYSVTTRTAGTAALERALVAVVFVGGALASILFFAAIAFSRGMLLASVALGGAVLGACLVHGRLAGVSFEGPQGPDWNLVAHVAAFSLAGAAIFVLVAADLARRRDSDALLLALWSLGTFAFATVVNYTTNGRTLLPMAPPVAILLARRLGAGPGSRRLAPALRYAPLVPALALALLVAWGDAALADASRTAARRIGSAHAGGPGTLWFEGSWGFQHYMRQAGGRPVDVRRNVLRPGDLMAGSDNWLLPLALSRRAAPVVDTFEIPLPWVTTMLHDTGTGFYAIQWGPLPYRFLAGASERFQVRRLVQPEIFEGDPREIERRARELSRAATSLATLLALHARHWPDPRALGAGASGAGPGAAAWDECAPGLQRLGDAVSEHCRWCATQEDCLACRDAEARRTGLGPACARLLEAALRETAARCGRLAAPPAGDAGAGVGSVAAPDPVCAEVRRIRPFLTGERDPQLPDDSDRVAPRAGRR